MCGFCTRTDIVREHLEDNLRICDVSAKGLLKCTWYIPKFKSLFFKCESSFAFYVILTQRGVFFLGHPVVRVLFSFVYEPSCKGEVHIQKKKE